jgi:DNA topoisomerase-2
MKSHSSQEITDYEGEDYTLVRFKPDLKQFKLKNLTPDIVALFKKRVGSTHFKAYDLGGILDKKVGIWLNGKKIKVSSFEEYIGLYKMEENQKYPKIHEVINNRWEVLVTVSESQFMQASFVNCICTSRGGTHVNAIIDQITEKLAEQIKKKNKVDFFLNLRTSMSSHIRSRITLQYSSTV